MKGSRKTCHPSESWWIMGRCVHLTGTPPMRSLGRRLRSFSAHPSSLVKTARGRLSWKSPKNSVVDSFLLKISQALVAAWCMTKSKIIRHSILQWSLPLPCLISGGDIHWSVQLLSTFRWISQQLLMIETCFNFLNISPTANESFFTVFYSHILVSSPSAWLKQMYHRRALNFDKTVLHHVLSITQSIWPCGMGFSMALYLCLRDLCLHHRTLAKTSWDFSQHWQK